MYQEQRYGKLGADNSTAVGCRGIGNRGPKDRGTAAVRGDVCRRGYNNRSKNGPRSLELITCGDFLALFVGIMNPHSLP